MVWMKIHRGGCNGKNVECDFASRVGSTLQSP